MVYDLYISIMFFKCKKYGNFEMSKVYNDHKRKNWHINDQNRISIQYILFYIQKNEHQYKKQHIKPYKRFK